MKGQPVEFFDAIEADMRDAREFYASWQFDGARVFMDKFRKTIELIESNPELFPRRCGFFHRAMIRRTYYAIYYAIEADKTSVVAVLDNRRDPATIRAMLNQRWTDTQ